MEEQIYPPLLLEEINSRRERLNKMVTHGIDDLVINASQELDLLITQYAKFQLRSHSQKK